MGEKERRAGTPGIGIEDGKGGSVTVGKGGRGGRFTLGSGPGMVGRAGKVGIAGTAGSCRSRRGRAASPTPLLVIARITTRRAKK